MINSSDFKVRRQQLSSDLHRPRYHYLPPSNWMNDPNGLIQWKGTVHLFYQYNPSGSLWGNMHWGHASSPDFIHWTDLPIALAPTVGGPDETGVFSGCAVDNNGVPTIIYTGTRGTTATSNDIQTQCLATGDDQLLTWTKHASNPIIGEVPTEANQTRDFRDPFVWKDGDTWYMVLGSRILDVGGVIFLYRSGDLIHWDYLNPLITGEIKRNGVTWECPNFFPIGDTGKWALIISAHLGDSTGAVLYMVGTYDNQRFTPEYESVLDYGELYAPLSFIDDKKRRILFGWIREGRANEALTRAGWAGAQSLPRILGLDMHNRLTMQPVPEAEILRENHHHYGPIEVTQPIMLDISGHALDIVAEFAPTSSGVYGIAVACSTDGKHRTDISYDAATAQISVRTITPDSPDGIQTARSGHVRVAPHTLDAGEPLKLRILLDGSVVETIANERTSITSRTYPTDTDATHLKVFGTAAQLTSLDVWQMRAIWE